LSTDVFALDLTFETVTPDEFLSGTAIVVGTLGVDTDVEDDGCVT
jgi:hypothetical protein